MALSLLGQILHAADIYGSGRVGLKKDVQYSERLCSLEHISDVCVSVCAKYACMLRNAIRNWCY